MSTVKTLDYLAAKTAHELVEAAKQHNAPKDIENVITKALGVLQAQGVYALYLFLYSQAEGNKPATYLLRFLWNELKDDEVRIPLPSGVTVVPLQNNEVLFCKPRQLAGIIRRLFKSKGQAEQARDQANNCVAQIRHHANLWSINEEDFRDLRYELREFLQEETREPENQETQENQERNRQWRVQPYRPALHQRFIELPSAREIILANIRDLTADLDTLLLVRDLYEQTLVYARYHAKALG